MTFLYDDSYFDALTRLAHDPPPIVLSEQIRLKRIERRPTLPAWKNAIRSSTLKPAPKSSDWQ